MSLERTSTVFQPGAVIPEEYTAVGADRSPLLAWSGKPSETKGLALICSARATSRGDLVHLVLL